MHREPSPPLDSVVKLLGEKGIEDFGTQAVRLPPHKMQPFSSL